MYTMLCMGNGGMNQDFKPISKRKFKRMTLLLWSKNKQLRVAWGQGKGLSLLLPHAK